MEVLNGPVTQFMHQKWVRLTEESHQIKTCRAKKGLVFGKFLHLVHLYSNFRCPIEGFDFVTEPGHFYGYWSVTQTFPYNMKAKKK